MKSMEFKLLDGVTTVRMDYSYLSGRARVYDNNGNMLNQTKKNHFVVTDADNNINNIYIKPRIMGLDFPNVFINELNQELTRDLSTYELVLSFLPLILVFIGGAIGAIFGVIATMIIIKIMRNFDNYFVKFMLWLIVVIVTYLVYDITAYAIINAIS